MDGKEPASCDGDRGDIPYCDGGGGEARGFMPSPGWGYEGTKTGAMAEGGCEVYPTGMAGVDDAFCPSEEFSFG
jgi:hypothetical protein